MLVGNHAGGVAIDGMMFMASCLFELDPPRLAQGMVEKFMGMVPGLAQMAAKMGQFTGLPEHASRLLDDERLIMVFPQGARGTAKLAHEAHSLVRFGTGFMRLALKGKAPIVPVAFMGGGEAMPTVTNLYGIGKLFGVPYIPITKYLLPVPMPATFHILYSEPMCFEGTGNESDTVIRDYVDQVRNRIAWLLEQGHALREGKKKPEELELR
jgi:1-acyl-sn-glycerol-3-phosphate acyltransferase